MMLLLDFKIIGNKLYEIRKGKGMSRMQIAEKAEISDRTYADIERGSVNMRIETLLRICGALSITPDEMLTENSGTSPLGDEIFGRLEKCSQKEKETVQGLISVYLDSLNK